jgi:hypothetical protein
MRFKWRNCSAYAVQQFGDTVYDAYTRLKLGTFEHNRVLDVIKSLDLVDRDGDDVATFRRKVQQATGEPKLTFAAFYGVRPNYPIRFIPHFFRTDNFRDREGLDQMLWRLPTSMIARTYRKYLARLDPLLEGPKGMVFNCRVRGGLIIHNLALEGPGSKLIHVFSSGSLQKELTIEPFRNFLKKVAARVTPAPLAPATGLRRGSFQWLTECIPVCEHKLSEAIVLAYIADAWFGDAPEAGQRVHVIDNVKYLVIEKKVLAAELNLTFDQIKKAMMYLTARGLVVNTRKQFQGRVISHLHLEAAALQAILDARRPEPSFGSPPPAEPGDRWR